MIEKARIEAVKQGVDLVALIKSRGIELKKKGKGFVGLCPFHAEATPSFSVNPAQNLWQCFGCGTGGDSIRFVELFDKIGFPEAVGKLDGTPSAPAPPATPAAAKEPAALTAKQIKLLTRVIEFYHKTFSEDGRAREYLAGRCITDNALFAAHCVGFANGTLLNVLPQEGDVIDGLKELGILNERGNEHFYGCATFPLYDLAGNPASIYGRRIEHMDNGESPPHLYLPGPRRGLFNRQAAKSHKEIILTESVIDSLTLIASGIHNTIPCYGTNGLTADHLALFKLHKPEAVTIAFDGDESGRKGAENVTSRLAAEGINAHSMRLPEDEDINSLFYLTANAKGQFLELLHQANPENPKGVVEGKTQEPETKADSFTPTDYGFTATLSGRRYEVRGITKGDSKLKATVKGIGEDGGKKRFHVDTVDFYSARSRAFLIKGLCDLFGESDEIITRDLERLAEQCEAWQEPETAASAAAPEITPADKEAALAFLKNPDMFTEILADFETLGYTGEEMNKLLCYLAAVSRKIDEPISVMIQSRSAAGKSFLQDTVLSMIPEGDCIKYTRLTDQALFYKDSNSLAHKILAVEELDGMNGAIYSIRAIQSSKKITIAYTGKDAATGKLKTEENTVEGPLSVFITTTKTDIDGETASRFVFLSIDESREMTERILAKQRQNYTRAGIVAKIEAGGVREKHRNASRLLQPLKVINPYADLLTFTSHSLRARRDHVKYQNLILAITYLYQYQREQISIEHGGKSLECVIATLEDIAKANEIAGEVLGRSLDELSPPSRRLLGLIKEMVDAATIKEKKLTEYRFNRRQIREYSGWSDFQVRTHMTELEELEYIFAASGKRGKEYVYELVYTGGGEDGRPFLVGLIDIEQLRKKAEEAGIGEW
ncbi:MAG: toprim domain-containing protein [Geobacteraceae bacterium]|nr:toprim domain-containing protein [Geobacteraceae bacterium]